MRARNLAIAARTVINDAYASGNLVFGDDKSSGETFGDNYLVEGSADSQANNTKLWWVGGISAYMGSDRNFRKDVADLSGEPYVPNMADLGSWNVAIMGSGSSTVLDADGFCMLYFPQGNSGDAATIVTFKIDPVANPIYYWDAYVNGSYNPDAGYEVYHLVL
jgi:hypothetical protein